MKHLLHTCLWILICFTAATVLAQGNTYTQAQPSTCFLSDGYVCNGIQLTPGESQYQMRAVLYTKFSPGDPVAFDINGQGYTGSITEVVQQPVYEFGTTSPFSFNFAAGSISGTVSGVSEVEHVGRWSIVIIESSKVVLN